MSARRKGRKRALDILYAADVRDLAVNEVLEQERLRAADEPDRASSWELAQSIVEIAISRWEEIDQLIARPLELDALGRLRQFNQIAGRLHRDFDIPYTVLHGKYIDRELQGLTGAKDSGEGA